MAETVNEPALFEESDFADDQTTNEASPAVEETTEQPTSTNDAKDSTDGSTKEENANEPQTGDEIEEFLAKKGVKLDDPEALRKVAEMYRNVEKDYGKKSQEKAQLERQIAELSQQPSPATTSADPMERLQNLERQVAADRQIQATREWKAAKNLSPDTEAKMVEFLSQPIIANGVVQTDRQGNQLTKYFYRAVGGESVKADAIKKELKDAVVKEIATKQTAKSPAALSTDPTQFAKPKSEEDEFLSGLFG